MLMLHINQTGVKPMYILKVKRRSIHKVLFSLNRVLERAIEHNKLTTFLQVIEEVILRLLAKLKGL